MIVWQNKGYETNSLFPNLNLYPDNSLVKFIIDETMLEGKILCDKIQQLYPNYDFIYNENNELIDVAEILPDDPRYIPKEIL